MGLGTGLVMGDSSFIAVVKGTEMFSCILVGEIVDTSLSPAAGITSSKFCLVIISLAVAACVSGAFNGRGVRFSFPCSVSKTSGKEGGANVLLSCTTLPYLVVGRLGDLVSQNECNSSPREGEQVSCFSGEFCCSPGCLVLGGCAAVECSAREVFSNMSEEEEEVCKGDSSPGGLVPSEVRSGAAGEGTLSFGDLVEVVASLILCSLLPTVTCSSLLGVVADPATVTSLAGPISALTLTLLLVAGGCVNEERGKILGTGCGVVFCVRLTSFLLE